MFLKAGGGEGMHKGWQHMGDGTLPLDRALTRTRPPSATQVSEDCRDLLRGLLTANPAKRLTVAQVQSHPWFLQDLPAGALEVNSRLKLMDNVR